MLVLKILGVLLALFSLFKITQEINKFTNKRYRYLFFNKKTLLSSFAGYASAIVGYIWYTNALQQHGDILNGKLLMIIGALFLFWTVVYNIANTSFFIGTVFTLVQQISYLIVAAGGIILYVIMIAVYADAKPVYRID